MSMYIWMAVTPDEYELPIALEDSSAKLAELLGISASTVRGSEFRDRSGELCGMRFVKVRNDDEDSISD